MTADLPRTHPRGRLAMTLPEDYRGALRRAWDRAAGPEPIDTPTPDQPIEAAEVERLRRWKDEALSVMAGLQDLGDALGVGLGERITGEGAAERARALVAEVERLGDLVQTLANDATARDARATSAEQERDRYREALETIAGATTIADAVPDVRAFARDALAGAGEQPGEDHEPDLSDGVPDDDGKALPAGLCYRCQRPADAHRPAPVVPDSPDVRERLAEWWRTFDGPAYPTGEQFADALLASGLAVVGQGVTAESPDDAAHRLVQPVLDLLEEESPYLFDEAGDVIAWHVIRAAFHLDRAVVRSGEQGGEA